mmetsp:Transcript_3081/g.6972  ORF Transcript_3081/g.6972 Transcript_3081/m.6972 type:complete len:226 (+) Transcript_3081:631-1308(+)
MPRSLLSPTGHPPNTSLSAGPTPSPGTLATARTLRLVVCISSSHSTMHLTSIGFCMASIASICWPVKKPFCGTYGGVVRVTDICSSPYAGTVPEQGEMDTREVEGDDETAERMRASRGSSLSSGVGEGFRSSWLIDGWGWARKWAGKGPSFSREIVFFRDWPKYSRPISTASVSSVPTRQCSRSVTDTPRSSMAGGRPSSADTPVSLTFTRSSNAPPVALLCSSF